MCDQNSHVEDNQNNAGSGLGDFIGDAKNKASILLELYLEFFAIFIPGFLLVAGLVALLSIDPSCYKIFEDFFTLDVPHVYKFFLLIIISYAVGSILHRQSPDRPDEISAILTWKIKSCNIDAVSSKKHRKYCLKPLFLILPETLIRIIKYFYRFVGTSPEDLKFIKYPYDSLRNYLKERGLEHLLKYVPWCVRKNHSTVYRNRGIINEYKTIIKFYGPKVFLSELIRHESNSRMFTSLWHVLKHLTRVWWIVSVVALARLFYSFYISKTTDYSLHYYALQAVKFFFGNYGKIAIWFLVLYIMLRAKHGIESTLHYLRLKEIVTILQQVYILEMRSPGNKIWNHIRMRNGRFFCSLAVTNCLFRGNRCRCQINSAEKINEKIPPRTQYNNFL